MHNCRKLFSTAVYIYCKIISIIWMSCHSFNNKTLVVTSPTGFSETIYEWMCMNLKKSMRVKHPPSVKEVTYSIYYITYSIGDSIIGATK